MKYFMKEYLNNSDVEITEDMRNTNLNKWNECCEKYSEYFQNNIDIFSKKFIKAYLNGGFHDYKIKNIDLEYIEAGKKYNVIINLIYGDKEFHLISKDVINYSAKLDINDKFLLNNYLYGEYYKDDKGLWYHNFLFGDYFEINIVSKKFIFK